MRDLKQVERSFVVPPVGGTPQDDNNQKPPFDKLRTVFVTTKLLIKVKQLNLQGKVNQFKDL